MKTPDHIAPVWYFTPFYAILRAVPIKELGVLAMFGAIIVMALVPWLDTSRVRSGRYRPSFKWWFWILAVDFVVLTWAGAMPAEGIYPYIALAGATYWFAYFLVILPLLGVIDDRLRISVR